MYCKYQELKQLPAVALSQVPLAYLCSPLSRQILHMFGRMRSLDVRMTHDLGNWTDQQLHQQKELALTQNCCFQHSKEESLSLPESEGKNTEHEVQQQSAEQAQVWDISYLSNTAGQDAVDTAEVFASMCKFKPPLGSPEYFMKGAERFLFCQMQHSLSDFLSSSYCYRGLLKHV